MDKKVKIFIFTILILGSGFLIYETANGNLISFAFDQISYNHTAYASIPNDTHNSGSLGGFYNIYGKGNKFNFNITMPGAEDYEDPLCYTKDGLKGNGTIDNVKVTFNTINNLINRNFIKAMFQTPVSGHFEMSCAAWTGYGTFSNNGTYFPGNFQIIGPDTDWQGTFQFVQEGNKIAVKTNYIVYRHGQPNVGNVSHVNKTYYM